MRIPTVLTEQDHEKAALICSRQWVSKICPICNIPFLTTDKRTETCSNSCRQAKYMALKTLKLSMPTTEPKSSEKASNTIVEEKVKEASKPVKEIKSKIEQEAIAQLKEIEDQTILEAEEQLKEVNEQLNEK